MIDELSSLIDGFLGKAMHVRCFDHSLNLMAKVRGFRVMLLLASHWKFHALGDTLCILSAEGKETEEEEDKEDKEDNVGASTGV